MKTIISGFYTEKCTTNTIFINLSGEAFLVSPNIGNISNERIIFSERIINDKSKFIFSETNPYKKK